MAAALVSSNIAMLGSVGEVTASELWDLEVLLLS
jgi:hypothetical protein